VATAAEANKQLAVVYDPSSAWLDVVEVALAAQGVTVAGRAQDAEPAIALVEQHRPHLLVADPAGAGIDVLREARARVPALKAIALGRGSESEQVEAAFSAGAVAFVVKSESYDAFGATVREILQRKPLQLRAEAESRRTTAA
jgi:DNA-binding NarL/FixJ family response regulator